MSVGKLKPNERREQILKILCIRREETVMNLANELGVSRRTILYDIDELTLSHPIETARGKYGGGVKVMDGYYIGRKYLKPKQKEALIQAISVVDDKTKTMLESILNEFSIP